MLVGCFCLVLSSPFLLSLFHNYHISLLQH
jgi:hypothetical protein